MKTVTKWDVPVYDEVSEEQLATQLVPNDTIDDKVDGPGLKRPRGGASLPPAGQGCDEVVAFWVLAFSPFSMFHAHGALCCIFDLALISTRPRETNFEPRAGENEHHLFAYWL